MSNLQNSNLKNAKSKVKLFTPLGIDPDFLNTWWQQRPCLIRQGLIIEPNPISAEVLAGLAFESDIESRIVIGDSNQTTPHWSLRNGPFDDETFAALGESGWTLLIQDIDKLDAPFHPSVTTLLQAFNFIPNWRFDDLMISYATDGGSVGPHWDDYDVFLIQVEGRRQWSIGNPIEAGSQPKLLSNCELRLLADFQATETWILEPGDILYLPPGVPHYGIAQGECMTWSVGYRAPSRHELLDYSVQRCLDSADSRYTDPDRPATKHSHKLDNYDLQRLSLSIREQLTELDNNLNQHIAAYLSISKAHQEPESPQQPDNPFAAPHSLWAWHEGSRRLYTRDDSEHCRVFVGGLNSRMTLPEAAINQWLAAELFSLSQWLHAGADQQQQAFLSELIEQGHVQRRVRIETVAWEAEAENLSTIRRAVFIEEQSVPEALEWDGEDADCQHVLAITTDGDEAIACGRLKADGQIGRMAVLPEWRNLGIGDAVLSALLACADQQGTSSLWLNAQIQASAFYQRRGFKRIGEIFPDAGIPHVRMQKE